MTPPVPWHPDVEALQAYVDGESAELSAASVEAHLQACAPCRGQLRAAVPVDRLARLRCAVEDRVDGIERPWFERLLIRIGLQEADVRALLATPALRAAWWLAVLSAIALALLVWGGTREPGAVFMLLAPLIPVCTTALAYAPTLDPALLQIAATPYSTSRMLLARCVAVGVTALVGTAAAALALPGGDVAAVAWLVPAVALTLTALALSPRLGAASATAVVGSAWVGLVALLHREGINVVDLLGLAGQLVLVGVALAALVVVVDQQKGLDGGEAT